TLDLTIVGDSDIKLKRTANINILKRQPIDNYEAESDLLVCMLNKSGTQIPGKVFHYAATNKPILLLLDGEHGNEIGKYFSEFNRYYICNNNIEEIENMIRQIIKKEENFKPVHEFSSFNIAKELLSIIDNRRS